jgi:hypothetical protein
MLTEFTKILMFLSSYIPLYIILAVKFYNVHPILSVILAIASLILFYFTKWFLNYWSKKLEPTRDKVLQVERKDSEVIAYVFAYIFPFVNDSIFSGFQNIIAYLIFFLLLMLIYVRSNLIHINPILYAFGYYIYSIVTENNKVHIILSRNKRVLSGDIIQVVAIGDDLFLEKVND